MTSADNSGRNRRRYPRLETLGLVDGHLLPTDSPLTVRDLSLGGFATESSMPFTPGASYAFRFTTADGANVELGATAVHCRLAHVASDGRHSYLTGFEFLESPSGRASLEAIVDMLSTAVVRT